MASEEGRRHSYDPAARGFDGQTLSPVVPPAKGEVPSPVWLAQLGRAPIADETEGRKVVRRLTEDGLAVPGDDPLYQYLGAQRVIAAELRTQHDEEMARGRAMLDEARQGLVQLLAEVSVAGGAAVAARRGEDEAALKRFSAEVDQRIAEGVRKLREAMAEERDATAAAIAVAVAEALANAGAEHASAGGPGGGRGPIGARGSRWTGRGRSAALWAAVLGGSVIAGLVVLWVLRH